MGPTLYASVTSSRSLTCDLLRGLRAAWRFLATVGLTVAVIAILYKRILARRRLQSFAGKMWIEVKDLLRSQGASGCIVTHTESRMRDKYEPHLGASDFKRVWAMVVSRRDADTRVIDAERSGQHLWVWTCTIDDDPSPRPLTPFKRNIRIDEQENYVQEYHPMDPPTSTARRSLYPDLANLRT